MLKKALGPLRRFTTPSWIEVALHTLAAGWPVLPTMGTIVGTAAAFPPHIPAASPPGRMVTAPCVFGTAEETRTSYTPELPHSVKPSAWLAGPPNMATS